MTGDHLLDFALLLRQRDLWLHGQPKATFGDDLRVGLTDDFLDCFRHDRASVDTFEMVNRNLARPEAVQAHPILQLNDALVEPRFQIRGGDHDPEFAFETLGGGFGDLHGVISVRSRFAVRSPRRGAAAAEGIVPSKPRAWCGRRDSNPHDFRHGNLNPARLPIPPRPQWASSKIRPRSD